MDASLAHDSAYSLKNTTSSPDDVPSSQLSSTPIASLLEGVTREKQSLEDDIRATSHEQSTDVDQWIAQAKKVQLDIARCKSEAAEIVKGYEQINKLKVSAHDARSKVILLQGEIEFTASLQHELESIASTRGQLNGIQLDDPIVAASKLQALSISSLRSENARNILEDGSNQLRHEVYLELESQFDKVIELGNSEHCTWMKITSQDGLTPDNILKAMQQIGTLQRATERLGDKVANVITKPLVREYPISAESDSGRLVVKFGTSTTTHVVLDVIRTTVKYLYTQLPDLAVEPIAIQTIPIMVSTLINTHLASAIPSDLFEITTIQHLQEDVSLLSNDLKSYRWPGYEELHDWVEQLPHLWLRKRKLAALDAIKVALNTKRGPNYQVERVERQTISKEDAAFVSNGATDDWDADWGEEDVEAKPDQNEAEEDASGWGFDEKEKNGDADDTAEAWGWEDDGAGEDNKPSSPKIEKKKKQPMNGSNGGSQAEREITLAEIYTVTDIPDHVVQIIGKDLIDAQEVQNSTYSILHSASPSSGLLALPTHVLAMFRAITPDYYSGKLDSPSGNMHLYNDSLYIVQKLRENFSTLKPAPPALEPDCLVMERFARAAYAKEMDLQRTILGDILDGAQGFSSCTQQPFAMQCETAVTSAIERIRTIYAEWQGILSHSALLQSIGSLVATVANKMVTDILDMEDISEPESQRLTAFCTQVSTLNDLFAAEKLAGVSASGPEEEDHVPLTAVYVPHWLRFQYLANILESSLVEIKWLWTDGELRMEFGPEEVIDLIRALFAESTHRRQAIGEITRS